jgi:hypothetical protein
MRLTGAGWSGIAAAAVVAGAIAAGAAGAAPLTGEEARRQLFDADAVEVVPTGAARLSAEDSALLRAALASMRYYGAVAIPSGEGLTSEAAAVAVRYHDRDAAETAALQICERKRARSSRPCAVVAHILPRGWQARAFQMSGEATEAFLRRYRGAGGRAMAISRATGSWGLGRGRNAADAAIADCWRRAPGQTPPDCIVAIAD